MLFYFANIPDSVFDKLAANSFYFNNACIFGAKSPLYNVPMMADPVHKITAAVIIIPSPVDMNSRLAVRSIRSWSKPCIIIKFSRRSLYRIIRRCNWAVRQTDFDSMYFANAVIANDLASLSEMILRPLPASCLTTVTSGPTRP